MRIATRLHNPVADHSVNYPRSAYPATLDVARNEGSTLASRKVLFPVFLLSNTSANSVYLCFKAVF